MPEPRVLPVERQEINLHDTVRDLLCLMSEGNPEALRVLLTLMEDEAGMIFVLHLDDMNIRGSQVWIAFKDYAKEDMPTFVQAIKERSAGMIEVVNAEGLRGNHTHRAVSGGAPFCRRHL